MELKVEAADWEIPVGSGSYNLARRVSSEGLAEWILLSGESTVSIDVLEFGKWSKGTNCLEKKKIQPLVRIQVKWRTTCTSG